MTTTLQDQKTVSTAATSEGTFAFAVAVLMMLAVSTAALLHPNGFEAAMADSPARAEMF